MHEVDNHIYEVCESTCLECSAKDEVKIYKEDSVVEKANLSIKNDIEHNEKKR